MQSVEPESNERRRNKRWKKKENKKFPYRKARRLIGKKQNKIK